MIGLAILVAIGQALASEEIKDAYMRGASLLFVLLATPAIVLGLVRQIKVSRQVTVHTMMGVLCIYLLMSMAFAESFALIQVIGGEPFFRTGQGAEDLSNYLYFSITTITTAGLGDFSPAGDVGRSLTAAEALIGQIYLVTVVAVIVGNLGRRRPDGGDDSDRPAA
ncbi:MAG: two pore domain potassium channel family protein [Solirubrobacterales bacterium]|nr:two pore domain potassium channel family protein [Solirubrobacterales bacterium]